MTHDNSSYSAPAARSGTNGFAVASLICGIVGLLFFGIILGPVAIVLGVVALRQQAAKGGTGMAKAGLVLGVIDLLIVVVLIIAASNGGFSWYVGG
ncbi:DUF4190 domain-containing protein [Streptomyces sp. RTGN2]|uniref:DUF4190 domain-containing protein n=1 Tax=Streptomyces sp. RTGN2 TaxID=3016525 RepID=UPI00255275A4|nr:DUF4190 domain-containing protein [Streptomyces sp. RTGN2]